MASRSHRPVPATEHGIAMWGPPGSGKTTFLAALSVAMNRDSESGWRIHGADDASEGQLIRFTNELVTGRRFPSATQGIAEYSWVMNGPNPHARRRLFRKDDPDRVSVRLELVDAQGEIAGVNLNFTQRGQLIDNLARARGLIYIFDPVRESTDGDAFEHTFGMLVQLARRMDEESSWRNGRLPHHVAVCITKFDEPPVFRTAEKMGLVVPSDDDHEFPRVPEYDAKELFYRLCSFSGTGNADMVINALEQYFDRQRIRYFVTSAIGFHLPRDGKYDPDDPVNVLSMEEIDPRTGAPKTRIRGAVHPINVTESVQWLIGSILGDENGRA
jgi:hypothetical protein